MLIETVAVGAKDLVAVAPVLLDLNKELEEDLLLEETLHITACHRADLLQGDTTMTDDDALLAVTLDDDEAWMWMRSPSSLKDSTTTSTE